MKKAALYARVSSDLQKKEGTIQSQIEELRKQIDRNGDMLVKEYIDEGFSGARLDRPAMDELRKDLRSDVFDVIYFLNTDRIAREVTYQSIILTEIIRFRKQMIINGKDYIHNPENKFNVTVLGAVAELERAKIIERNTRGRQMRMRQGNIMNSGNNVYGYDYHRKVFDRNAYYTVNKEESKIVKFVFESYAKGQIGTAKLSKTLEEMGAPTKMKRGIWRASIIKAMLIKPIYTGTRYYNMMQRIREYANPMTGVKKTTYKNVKRDKSEWIGVAVPAIISKELFDKVQERIAWNRKRYRSPVRKQLLSNMTRCGYCGSSGFALTRYYRDSRTRGLEPIIRHIASYKCNYQSRMNRMHAGKTKMKHCPQKEIRSEILERNVFRSIQENMFDPEKLKEWMDYFRKKGKNEKSKIDKKLNEVNTEIIKNSEKRRNILDMYVNQDISREIYAEKSSELDKIIVELKIKKEDLLNSTPLLDKEELVEETIRKFCLGAKMRFENANDFDTKRQFILDYLDRIHIYNEKFELHGFIKIPNISEKVNDDELTKIKFCIDDKIPRNERICLQGRRTYNRRISVLNYRKIMEDQNKQD